MKKRTTRQEQLMSDLRNRKRPVTTSALADKYGVTEATIRSALRVLRQQGKVEVAEKQYTGRAPANMWRAA